MTPENKARAHVDPFARDQMPPESQQPAFLFDLPELRFPERLNCAEMLLHRNSGDGRRVALRSTNEVWTYRELDERSAAIANVLVSDLGVVPGNRVLLRAPNSPMLAACWLAVIRAGAIAVTTMPLLRAKDLAPVVNKARVQLALCDTRLRDDLAVATAGPETVRIMEFDGTWTGSAVLNTRAALASTDFAPVDTHRDDVALIAFSSGTTGAPKGTAHFHRDVLASCVCVGEHLLHMCPEDIVVGSPPLGFTFGLGVLLAFPLWSGACAVLLESAPPMELLKAIQRYGATVCATAPTAYRTMLRDTERFDLPTLRMCVSAGEHLPLGTFEEWERRTGLRLVNGMGATEMFHMFAGSSGPDIRPGSFGRALPGYRVAVLDEANRPVASGVAGRLAVLGPTGCRYLDDPRQVDYVQGRWNITGDVCIQDEDGYFWFQGRSDELIVTAGYNVSPAEVEAALLLHTAVVECAVVGVPDPEKGNAVKAFVRLSDARCASPDLESELKAHVKQIIAPYKYPRTIEFVDDLPRTSTGKVQRRALRQTGAPVGSGESKSPPS